MASALAAQAPPADNTQPGWRQTGEPKAGEYQVEPGTKIPLSLINSVSTKHSAEGDRVYLESVFPILVKGRVVIPPGSYVAGTLTEVKRPGRVRGRGELYLRFDSLTLPNGVTREFRARIGGLDGLASEELDRQEGKVRSEGNKAGDARTVGEATAAGTSVGVIAGSAAGHTGMGAGIGAAAGATAGLMGVLLSRGPDAVLAKGSTVEMILDRPLRFDESELNFSQSMQRVPTSDAGPRLNDRQRRGVPIPGRRWPL
jgi:type IV secretion system protein VirB10